MNADLLTGEARAYYESFRRNKPMVDIIAGRAVFTWHFVPQPDLSARTIDRLHDRKATAQAIKESFK